MTGRLEGRVAIVTGGGHGIGKAYCEGLAHEGARVVVADIDGAATRTVAGSLPDALALTVDVSEEPSTLAMAKQALERFGRIDVLVNNAAVFATIPIRRVPIEEITLEEWDRVMAVNLRGVFLCCRAVLPAMKRQQSGKIVNIGSGTALSGSPTRVHYVSSKGGVLAFTRTLAREVGPYGITVNSLVPGATASWEHTAEDTRRREERARTQAIPRVEVPADVVGTLLYLASSDSDFMTGQMVVVDGGAVMP